MEENQAEKPEEKPTGRLPDNQIEKPLDNQADKPAASKEKVIPRIIEEEMKQSYVDYAMSVIIGRALPDARDGLKPVHRRILFAMNEMGMFHNKPSKKSARIVGEVLGKYHPHGDTAVYDALVRMAQDFSLRYPLVQGQGNFGCFTGDTKVKLTDGRNLSFKDLIKEHKQGKINYTYTVNSKGLIEIAEIKNPRLTKKREKIMKLVLDNGEEIKCTLDHRFMLRKGTYKEAQKLKEVDSLMPIYLRLSTKEDNIKLELVGYQMVYQPNINKWVACHFLADKWNLENDIYTKTKGKVRHHINFNKFNNNPDNVKRVKWEDHWKLHSDHASELHKNLEYRKKIAEGRKRFWSDKKNKELHSKRLSERNKKNWKYPKYRKHMCRFLSELNKEFVRKHPELTEEKSKRLKKLWENENYREMMSVLKSKEMKKRWEKGDSSLNRFTSKKSKKIWSKPSHRKFISKTMKKIWQNECYKKERSEQSKKLWKDDEYRIKFPQNHFSKMAKKLWKNPEIKKLHHKKAILQWKDSEFREKFIAGVKSRNKQRLEEHPDFMRQITEKAKVALNKKWKNPSYKEKVMKSKILGFVNSLTGKYSKITPEIYEKERCNNCYPRIETALQYFNDFSDLVEQAKKYNHKIIWAEILEKREDVYDLTIEGTNNFALATGVFVHNSIDGDSPAAMRYTEAKLSRISEELLKDLEKETVKFVPNFDETLEEPSVLPAKIPNLLINGSAGIAVGMATNIPPHNIGEIIDATVKLIESPETEINELMNYIKGPDFPTAGIICNKKDLLEAYETGKGHLMVRAKTEIQEKANKQRILISEIPYMVNKAQLIEAIADLIRRKKLNGISDLRDESNKDGIRVIIELKQGTNPNVLLNQLYKHTRLQTTFGVMMIALVDNEPKTLNLKQLIQIYINHRQVIVRKRTEFDLKKASERSHLLAGIIIALENLDRTIELIKKSSSAEEAKNTLISTFKLTKEQALAILDIKLQKLTSMEQDKIREEQKNLLKLIDEFKSILASEQKILDIIKNELINLKEKYDDKRKTEIINEGALLEAEDLIEDTDAVITITRLGYIKRISPAFYRQQRRGGKGILAADTKDEDFVEHLFMAKTHSYLLFFTDKGKVYWLKVYEIPEAGRQAMGKAVVNLLHLDNDEKITAHIPIRKFDENHFLVMATKKGIIKKTDLIEYSNPRKTGIIAVTLDEGDKLINVKLTDGTKNIILATKKGLAAKFRESDIRSIGRTGKGVIGIRLNENDFVVGMETGADEETLLTITENGYGKRSKISDYRLINRGGKGVINIKATERNKDVVSIKSVNNNDELMFISKNGIMIRTPVKDISVFGRNTQGLRLMRLSENDFVVAAAKVIRE